MAYVVARRNGRFEIRESLHTSKGPRARTLAGFRVLTDDIVAAASRRAQRPFDAEAVIGSGRRAGASLQVTTASTRRGSDRFLAGSKSMARILGQPQAPAARGDAGAALIELLSFADTVRASQPPRTFEPLAFPVLSRLAGTHAGPHAASMAIAHRP
jgi:hypothetical protein